MVDRRRRHAGFDQLDPPAVHDLVVRRRADGHGPPEMVRDPQTHATDYAAAGSEVSALGATLLCLLSAKCLAFVRAF